MFLLLSSLPVILAAPQQMVGWWCLRSGHVAASSALCPLCRPLPRHPMTNYFPFVTEFQSSEGRGVFCCRFYQANLRLFPLVGHSWFDWELVFKLFNWGHWEAIGDRDLIFGLQSSHIMNLWLHFQALWEFCGGSLSLMTHTDLQIQYVSERKVNAHHMSVIQAQRQDCECF